MTISTILSEKAPAAIGPYSQAISADGWIYVSGQLGVNPENGILEDGVDNQCRRSLENIQAVLSQVGCSLDNVVKTTIFLKDMNDFTAVNSVYASFFPNRKPARSCVQVASLPKNGLIEIECVAHF